jgi:hypothetical protein
MEPLIVSLLLWVAAHSDYRVADSPLPEVRLLTPTEMTALYREQTGQKASAAQIDTRIQGYFSWADGPPGVIYLIHPRDTPGAADFSDPTENPLFRERLLHELVHFAQRTSGAYAGYACPARGEFDAYRLGGAYLRELGVADPMPLRMRWAQRFSACL